MHFSSASNTSLPNLKPGRAKGKRQMRKKQLILHVLLLSRTGRGLMVEPGMAKLAADVAATVLGLPVGLTVGHRKLAGRMAASPAASSTTTTTG
jgi:hypothetical protein